MIQMRTVLDVADNSGARKISCILPVGNATGRYAGLGDIITANVKESTPEAPDNVKKGITGDCACAMRWSTSSTQSLTASMTTAGAGSTETGSHGASTRSRGNSR